MNIYVVVLPVLVNAGGALCSAKAVVASTVRMMAALLPSTPQPPWCIVQHMIADMCFASLAFVGIAAQANFLAKFRVAGNGPWIRHKLVARDAIQALCNE